MRKFQTEIAGLKNLTEKMKNPLDGLSSKLTVAKERISELADELDNTLLQQKNLEKRLKINKHKMEIFLKLGKETIDIWGIFNRNNTIIIMVPDNKMKKQQQKITLLRRSQN